jgi:5-methylcytosine-specific restriction endonuclease McrA
MSRPDAPPIEIAERVLRILDEGRYTATYKQAVLVALLDLCLEHTSEKGIPPQTITTRQLAEKVCALYWPHTRVWAAGAGGRVLVQNRSGAPATLARGGGIVGKIREFRERIEAQRPGSAGLSLASVARLSGFEELIRDIEWTLIDMPLPKLQRVGERNPEWLYHIHWRDRDERDPAQLDKPFAKQGDVRRMQRGERSSFNNHLYFQPGVAAAFARLHALLRPYILRHWAEQVVQLNQLPDDDVMAFLFDHERADTGPVRAPLIALQGGRCFYCARPLQQTAHVDHFIPWARHPDNGIHNLVAADERCNGAKRDYLASITHLENWRARAVAEHESLARIAAETRWEEGAQRIVGVARAIYLTLPSDMPLWQRAREFEPSDPDALRRVLVA